MEEKIIIRGQFNEKNIFSIISTILAVVLLVISVCLCGGEFDDFIECILFMYFDVIGILFWLGVVFLLTAIYFKVMMSECGITVTNMRVHADFAFGQSIDLPYDKISSVGTCYHKGVFVGTSSGKIKCLLLSNQEEVYESIVDLLNERQK